MMPDSERPIETAPANAGDAETRAAFLETQLKASGRVNYLLQEAAAKVVWKNEHLRAAIRKALTDLAADQDLMMCKNLHDTAVALDALVGLPGTMAGLVLATEKAS